jgi:putative transposase
MFKLSVMINTSKADKTHYKHPYLLRGFRIDRPNHFWSADITWIPMQKGFMYMFAIIDVYGRYVLSWSISNSMDAEWCTEVLNEAIEIHGTPEIFNTDLGSQFNLCTLHERLNHKILGSPWMEKVVRSTMSLLKGCGEA